MKGIENKWNAIDYRISLNKILMSLNLWKNKPEC
jgi:hypothetical protein